ncbi:MAG: DUF916 domain-containing protein [Candidatus Berkelbacteria bacterium]|nr:MAG: DUF916 domain-containing protein [Candidatus Berkelbacteria bacterium]QQG51533.1 MAG: DUF916 domain-containing protein [Candidatus Berkelbacteria bacterium]
MKLKFILLLLIAFLLGSLFAVPGLTSAQSTTAIAVSPVSFDFGVNPGATETNVLKVTNTSAAELQLEARIENIVGADDRGQVTLTEEETEFSLTKWVTASPSRFTLKAKETRTISFTIKVPANAEPGGHYGSILIGTVASSDPGASTGSSIVQRVGSLLLVRVAGTAKESALATKFYPKNLAGNWEAITSDDKTTTYYIAKEEDFSKEAEKHYFNAGPVAFNLTFKNSGNVHFRPSGFVTIYNIFGKKVQELSIEPRNVFPGVERDLTVIWPQSKLWGGYYRAQLLAVYGQSNQTISATTTFWAFPWVAAVIIGTLLVFIIVARKRLFKVVKVLIRG